MQDDSNMHIRHRQRLKARFLENDFSGFADHEILELLLCYALPRKDTNHIGHALINKFGSLSKVLDADYSELCKFPEISEHSSLLLKLIPSLAREYLSDKNANIQKLNSYDAVGRFFTDHFIGVCNEECHALYLDNGYHLIDYVKISEGVVNASPINVRKIATMALLKKATYVAIAHNHPNSTVIPSGDDLQTTKTVESALSILGLNLLEHFVVSGLNYVGIKKIRTGDLDKIDTPPQIKVDLDDDDDDDGGENKNDKSF